MQQQFPKVTFQQFQKLAVWNHNELHYMQQQEAVSSLYSGHIWLCGA